MFKFLKRFYDQNEWQEVTYQEAVRTLSTTWHLNDQIIDMLAWANVIQCRFSELRVINEDINGNEMCLMPGLSLQVPIYYEYTDDGERVLPDHGNDLTQFVSDLMFYDSSDPEPMTIRDAYINIQEWTKEGVEFPEGLTPEILMIEWNGHIHADRT